MHEFFQGYPYKFLQVILSGILPVITSGLHPGIPISPEIPLWVFPCIGALRGSFMKSFRDFSWNSWRNSFGNSSKSASRVSSNSCYRAYSSIPAGIPSRISLGISPYISPLIDFRFFRQKVDSDSNSSSNSSRDPFRHFSRESSKIHPRFLLNFFPTGLDVLWGKFLFVNMYVNQTIPVKSRSLHLQCD